MHREVFNVVHPRVRRSSRESDVIIHLRGCLFSASIASTGWPFVALPATVVRKLYLYYQAYRRVVARLTSCGDLLGTVI